jgi:hypothetical protein
MDEDTIQAICLRAKELADAAPPLTTEQAYLLTSVYGRYPRGRFAIVTVSSTSGLN